MAKPKNHTLGQQIRALREKRGLVQVDLAARCGVREVSISRWERDLEVPRVQHLSALARALGCRVMLDDSGVTLLDGGDGRLRVEAPRDPALKPLRDAVDKVRALGLLALTEYARRAAELADQLVTR
jgi:transcriptional regulator with XRE-family HTH domain